MTDAMREALKPFADAATDYDEIPGVCLTHGDVEVWQQPNRAGYRLTVDDLRRARAALAAPGEPVAWRCRAKGIEGWIYFSTRPEDGHCLYEIEPLYASPRALDVEEVARAIHKAKGLNPDCLHQNYSDSEPADATMDNGKTAHFGWRNSVPLAEAAIAAIAKGSK